MMRVRMHKLGNGKAILIPKSICDILNLDVGTILEMTIDKNKIILERTITLTRLTEESREDPVGWE